MKRNKYFTFILIISILCALTVSFSACDFISYNKGTSKEEREYQQALAQSKLQYISELENLSSQDKYFDYEMRIYILCLTEGKNAINDCESLEEIKSVFDTNAEIIKSIKTIADYEEEENQRQIALRNAKTEYIEKLSAVSSAENYREAERTIFEFYLDSGITAINECTEIAPIEKIYSTYEDVILSIKTALQYETEEAVALEEYKQGKIAEISAYVDPDIYREAEKTVINNLITEYEQKITDSYDYTEIDNLVRDFKIKIYPVKTDAELYEDELEEQKADALQTIRDFVNIVDYRANEALIIRSIIGSFEAQLPDCDKKEQVGILVDNYKSMLGSVKDDKTLYEEERVALVEQCYNDLKSAINTDNQTEEFIRGYYEYCDKVKEEMLALKTKEEVNALLIEEKKEIYKMGAQANDAEALSAYQNILIEEIENYLDVTLYREEQRKEITYVCSSSVGLKGLSTYDETMAVYETAIASLDNIPTNDEMWLREDEEFIENLKSLYGENYLSAPESLTEANDYFELAEIIDYYAFYQLDWENFVRDSFRVKLNWAHKDAIWERNEVYWYCELLKSAVDIKAEFEGNSDYLVITLIPYRFASVSNSADTEKIIRSDNIVEFNSDKTEFIDRDEEFDNFPYYNFTRTADVWNSQQLWYALEYGYVPNCANGSPAEEMLNKAKSILREIIKEGMSDEEKIFNIYSWFGRNVQYDHLHTKYDYSSDRNNLPNEVISSLQSHFVEGALNDGLSVCIGYAKAYLLLLRMEGIEAKFDLARMSYMEGRNTINAITGSFHGYVLIKLNGAWYYSDPQKTSAGTQEEFISYPFLCLPKNVAGFYEVMNTDLETDNNIFMYEKLSFNGCNIFVKNKDELYKLLDEFYPYADNFRLSIFYDASYNECYIDLINFNKHYNVGRVNGNNVINELIISLF